GREVPFELTSVDLDDAGAGTQPDACDRPLTAAGGLDEGLGHALPPGAARERAGDGLLCRMRMRRSGVHAQLPEHLAAETALGAPPLRRLAPALLGVPLEQPPQALGLDAARVAGVPPVALALGLARADVELGCVDDDHVVAGIGVQRPRRLVLAPQQGADLARDAAEHGAIGVRDEP